MSYQLTTHTIKHLSVWACEMLTRIKSIYILENKPFETTCVQKLHRATQIQHWIGKQALWNYLCTEASSGHTDTTLNRKTCPMKLPVYRSFIGPHRYNIESENKPYETTCVQKLHRATQIQFESENKPDETTSRQKLHRATQIQFRIWKQAIWNYL